MKNLKCLAGLHTKDKAFYFNASPIRRLVDVFDPRLGFNIPKYVTTMIMFNGYVEVCSCCGYEDYVTETKLPTVMPEFIPIPIDCKVINNN